MAPSEAVLITGCSTGIGRATALALARAGVPTWATARRIGTLAGLADAGCRTLELDVTDEASRERAVKAVEEEHGAVGALVNNAGYALGGAVEELPLDGLRRQFETNVFGLVRMCQLVLPGMRAQGHGTIVNLGSGAGLVAPPASGAYAMTKFALEALSDALRIEVSSFGVRVVLLEPGAVRTEFMNTGRDSLQPTGGPYDAFLRNVGAMAERAAGENARGALRPEDVARTIVKAINARRPRTRYRLGREARITPTVRRLVPDRAWDRVLLRVTPFEDRAGRAKAS
ncbi:SDR family NAD(P)-dependent oxidoreductase [Spirillospora sp. NPDC029432]|uniref:SDR family NAD(P)-dependent oxidoreductase n=1 Tax=Spirillospora sp. NPDC029432 TaxID=3154599 RepID=UPI003454F4E0